MVRPPLLHRRVGHLGKDLLVPWGRWGCKHANSVESSACSELSRRKVHRIQTSALPLWQMLRNGHGVGNDSGACGSLLGTALVPPEPEYIDRVNA